MGRQSLGLGQQCIKSTSVSITPQLGTDRDVLFLKTCPIWWAFFKLSSSLSGARWKPSCYRAWIVLSSKSLMGEDGLWDQCQAILGCRSAACQRPTPWDGSAGSDAEAQAGLSLLLYPSDFLQPTRFGKCPHHPPTRGRLNSHTGATDEQPCWEPPHSFRKESRANISYRSHLLD